MDWNGANAHYAAALDWWAHSSDLETARTRYLAIVWKAALPEWRQQAWGNSYFPIYLSTEVFANAVAIARTPDEVARARFLLARAWMNRSHDRRAGQRVEEELAAILALGKQSEWYDDALFSLATWCETRGTWERDENGRESTRPDYARALETYRRLTSEFRKGESRYWDECQGHVRQITQPTLDVRVDRFFLPGSEVQYTLSWRNQERVDLELVPVDLVHELVMNEGNSLEWLEKQPLTRAPVSKWTHDAAAGEGRRPHEPGQETLVLAKKPETGAYVLRARGGGIETRALLLVSDAAVSVKVSGSQLLAWGTDARTGAPLAQADLRLWQRWYDGSWRRAEATGTTGADGVALFELSGSGKGGQYYVALAQGARASFAQGWIPGIGDPSREWRLYAYADRSAYRPGDAVHWKVWARTRFAKAYATPAGETLEWEVRDPQNTVVQSGEGALNAFGAAWDTLETTATMTLGEYQVVFRRKGKAEVLGSCTLFRLEEYKLPEYEVRVLPPLDADGRAKLFRLGDRVEVEVEATYYYGAPVAGASVEVFVHQRPRYRPIPMRHEYPWYYEDRGGRSFWGGPGQQILHETRTSGPDGKVAIAFETPPGVQGEFEFTVQARVVDASRREISGTGSVVVAAEGYRVEVEVDHAIHRPGAKVAVELRALDPNGNPVADQGQVTVTRDRWVEVWRDPTGREVFGDELERLRSSSTFPAPGWGLSRNGYERETITRVDLATGEDGTARFEFAPPREGYYRIAWDSTDQWDGPIHAEGFVYVADERTRQLGYLPGGIEILVDRDTLEVGKEASILLLAPQSGRWVLFTVEGEELTHHEVVHLEGQVKLMKLAVTADHVPNVFLGAVATWDGVGYEAHAELVVPPVKEFLSVTVQPDEPEHEPGSEGRLTIEVRDHQGAPVAGELSIALIDEAVAYIQGDYALDPRQFFYGEKRPLLVQTGGSFRHGTYADLRRKEGNELRDVRLGQAVEESEPMADGFFLGMGGRQSRGAGSGPMSKAVALESRALAADAPGFGGPSGPGGTPQEDAPVVRVRSDFRATALWLPDVKTDAEGRASVPVRFPDSTTRWQATARACDAGTRIGQGTAGVRTRLPLIARLQTPRFLTVGDEATLSGNLNNNTGEDLSVQVALTVQGLEVVGLVVDGKVVKGELGPVQVPADGQTRVDWRVLAREPGTATCKLAVLAGEVGDAVERTLPVHAHGIEAYLDLAGKLDPGTEAIELALVLPAERRPGSTRARVSVAPSLAVTMLDALPYLIDYPYGCVEQTLSRFLPAVVVARTLREQGLSPEDAMTRVFGGIERDSAAKTHPKGAKSLDRLTEITSAGLERLYDFQHADGGWAWWKEGDSNPFMTAYVLWGLSLASEAGLDVRGGVRENAARWLAAELVEAETQPDLQAWLLHALAVDGGAGRDADARRFQAKAFENLWARRDALNAYGRALLCLAAVAMERPAEARTLADNLRNGAIHDATPDTSVLQVGSHQPYTIPTVHWGRDGIWYRWSDGGVESTAFVLRALVAVDPKDALVAPAMNWLVKNRRGAQWSNTRDTAISVLALNDYLRASGELGQAVEYQLEVNGTRVASVRLEKEQLLASPGVFELDPTLLVDGANVVRLTRKDGAGPLYFAVRAAFFSLEEPIPPRGSELFVRRDCYRLAARETLLAGTVYERVPLADGDALESGERVEVVLTVEAKNDLEYLVFEDLKPAGLEAVQVRSGEPISAQELKRDEAARRFAPVPDGAAQDRRRRGTARDVAVEARVGEGYTGRTRHAHQELRDRQVAFFLEALPQGTWELRYELRAEVPGRFHGLPTLGHAMYVPEIHANGAELRLEVRDPQ